MAPHGKMLNSSDQSSRSCLVPWSQSPMPSATFHKSPRRMRSLLLALSLFLSGCSMAPLQLSQQQKLACAVFPLMGLTPEGESLLLNQPLPTYKSLLKEQVLPNLSIQNLSNQTYFTTGVSASCRF